MDAFESPPRHHFSNKTFTDYFNSIKNNFIIFVICGNFNAKHNFGGCCTNTLTVKWYIIMLILIALISLMEDDQ
jgi:hypothetical protein